MATNDKSKQRVKEMRDNVDALSSYLKDTYDMNHDGWHTVNEMRKDILKELLNPGVEGIKGSDLTGRAIHDDIMSMRRGMAVSIKKHEYGWPFNRTVFGSDNTRANKYFDKLIAILKQEFSLSISRDEKEDPIRITFYW